MAHGTSSGDPRAVDPRAVGAVRHAVGDPSEDPDTRTMAGTDSVCDNLKQCTGDAVDLQLYNSYF